MDKMRVVASREGYNGENILITDIEEDRVFVEVGEFKQWVSISYRIVEDGVYNQSVKNIALPYIVINRDVYSIDSFHTWDHS